MRPLGPAQASWRSNRNVCRVGGGQLTKDPFQSLSEWEGDKTLVISWAGSAWQSQGGPWGCLLTSAQAFASVQLFLAFSASTSFPETPGRPDQTTIHHAPATAETTVFKNGQVGP